MEEEIPCGNLQLLDAVRQAVDGVFKSLSPLPDETHQNLRLKLDHALQLLRKRLLAYVHTTRSLLAQEPEQQAHQSRLDEQRAEFASQLRFVDTVHARQEQIYDHIAKENELYIEQLQVQSQEKERLLDEQEAHMMKQAETMETMLRAEQVWLAEKSFLQAEVQQTQEQLETKLAAAAQARQSEEEALHAQLSALEETNLQQAEKSRKLQEALDYNLHLVSKLRLEL